MKGHKQLPDLPDARGRQRRAQWVDLVALRRTTYVHKVLSALGVSLLWLCGLGLEGSSTTRERTGARGLGLRARTGAGAGQLIR